MLKALIIFLSFITLFITSNAQFTIDSTYTPEELVNDILLGPGTIVENIEFKINETPIDFANISIGYFADSMGTDTINKHIGIKSGIILSTGHIYNAIGPNDVSSATKEIDKNNSYNDAQLDNLATLPLYDIVTLEFDFTPVVDSATFNYVFASEEYHEFVDAFFNDVFGFFLSGPKPSGGMYVDENIALIPETSTTVSIDNVNAGKIELFGTPDIFPGNNPLNINYFNANGNGNGSGHPVFNVDGQFVQYDGFTKVLQAKTPPLIPCSTYHIKLAIADAGDAKYDSSVFLEAKSFKAGSLDVQVTTITGDSLFPEGCGTASFLFVRYHHLDSLVTINFDIGGNAINGDDYTDISGNILPDSITFPVGEDSILLEIVPILDSISEPNGDTLTVTIYNQLGCDVDTIVATLHIIDVAPFTANGNFDSTICTFDSILLNPNITNGVEPYNYEWSNNSIDTSTFITANNDTIVTLIVSDLCQSTDTLTYNLYTHPLPSAGFIHTKNCANYNILFTDTSVIENGQITGWTWYFNDSSTSNIQHPEFNFPDSGSYPISLITTSNFNCIDSISKTIKINPTPIAGFTYNYNCLDSVIFTDTTQYTGSDTLYYEWFFGTGDTSHAQNPIYVYDSIGNYTITLVVTSDSGCSDTISKPFNIAQIPNVNIGYINFCLNEFTQFYDSTSQATIVDWVWSFGDGDSAFVQNPTHLYSIADTFSITLQATTDYGCTFSAFDSIIIAEPPIAGFFSNDSCTTTINFTDTSSTNSGVLTNFIWQFGDNDSAFIQNPTHNYDSAGNYQVILFTQSNNGCFAADTQIIDVNEPPVADFIFSQTCFNDSTSLNSISNAYNDSIINYNWFNNANLFDTLSNTLYHFPDTGWYNISLAIMTDKNCVDTITKNIFINPTPTAGFISNPNCADSILFTDTSLFIQNSTPTWVFNNNDTTSNSTVWYSFDSTGNYPVQLIHTTDSGCSDTVIKNINYEKPPIASFTAQNFCYQDIVQFTDLSTTNSTQIIAWQWNFGDGTTSFNQNPTHTYQNTGNYNISLTVTTISGCSSSITNSITITQPPIVNFGFDNVCANSPVNFSDSTIATYPIQNWHWNFGDNSYSQENSPSHNYSNNGTYTVKLIVELQNGCSDSISKNINILENPIADFTITDTSICLNQTAEFNNNSTINNGSITSYQWLFGDGQSAISQNPTHTYPIPGNYQITLHISADNGCTSSYQDTLTVYPVPNANFFFNNVCLNDTSYFNNLSTITNDSITQYLWDLGDGTILNTQNVSHFYDTPGLYDVFLQIESSNGCTDTLTQEIQIYSNPIILTNNTNNLTCYNNCTGSISVSAIGAVSPYQYYWNDANNQTTPTATNLCAGTYTVLVTDANNCSQNQTITITEPAPIATSASSSMTSCQGICDGAINVSVTNAQTPISYNWAHTSNNTNSIDNLCSGTYYVTITDANGCEDSLSIIVEESNYIPPLNIYADDSSIYFGESTTLHATDSNYTYQWEPTETTENPNQANTSISPITNTTYTLSVTDENGCTNTENIDIIVITNSCNEPYLFIPNAFSPNNDGKHDFFEIKGEQLISNIELNIFDRWGNKVFETTDITQQWDGTYNNKPCHAGVYVYYLTITCVNNEIFTKQGNITLIR